MPGKRDLRKRKKRRSWRGHLAWLVPAAIGALLLVLILAIPPVRRVIFRPSEAAEADQAALLADPSNSDPRPPVPEETASLESSEPGLEVLPPPAASTPGRRVPKLLLVGSNKQMFPTLEAAVTVAIPGDIIEIRTNRPLLPRAADRQAKTREKTIKDVPVTIRAGRLYQPIVRTSGDSRPMLNFKNVDVTIIGVHFTAGAPGTILGAENSNVLFHYCTFTSIPDKGTLSAASFVNSQGAGKPLRLTVSHCFFRQSAIGSFNGPSVAVAVHESGFVGGHYALGCDLDKSQSLFIRQSTFQNTYLLYLSNQKPLLKKPFSFTMERSLFAHVACCPMLFELVVGKEFALKTPADYDEAVRQTFDFKAGDNIAQFWGIWANVSHPGLPGRSINESIFAEFPQHGDTLRFGKRIEEIRYLIHQKGNPPATKLVWASVLPEDLIPVSKVLAEKMRNGRRYGCDVTQLPVPPLVTLQTYAAPANVKKK